jgi:probable HAF family extracellular repeat protein
MPVYTYTTLDDPSAASQAGGTTAYGINNAGQIVGFYANAGGLDGFLLSGGTYTTIHDPLATRGTVAYGINTSGQIVGNYQNGIGSGSHGFLYNPNGGTYTTLDNSLGARGTLAFGINASGLIVGTYIDANSRDHGFRYDPSNRHLHHPRRSLVHPPHHCIRHQRLRPDRRGILQRHRPPRLSLQP